MPVMPVCPSVSVSVRPHRTTRFPLDGFSWNLIFEYFSKICQENTSFIKIWQLERVRYTKNITCFGSYLARLLLEWEFRQNSTKLFFPSNIVPFVRQYGKILQSRAGHGFFLTIWLMPTSQCVPKPTQTHTHTHLEFVILTASPLQQ